MMSYARAGMPPVDALKEAPVYLGYDIDHGTTMAAPVEMKAVCTAEQMEAGHVLILTGRMLHLLKEDPSMNMELARKYAPYLSFDRKEPFYPALTGVTFLKEGDNSPSFRRSFYWEDYPGATVIEYALYWDYDIQHMYDLEHVWIYVGRHGEVLDAEASFHGKYLKGLLPDRSNLEEETHVRLYSQPGKHAFLPKPELFELVPDLRKATKERAGVGGLLITGPMEGVLEKEEGTDLLVEKYLFSEGFIPSMEFIPYTLTDDQFVSWEVLSLAIPERIEACLNELRSLSL